MPTGDESDLDWSVGHVVVPSRIDRQPIGPARAWQGRWNGLAQQVLSRADDSPVGWAARQAVGQGFVLAREQARRHGMVDADIRRHVRRGEWTALGAGVVAVLPRADGQVADAHLATRHAHALAASAAVLRRPNSVIAGASAVLLHGLPALRVPEQAELAVRFAATTGRRSNVWVRVTSDPADEDDHWFGARVASILGAIGDVARRDPSAGLMAADAALHERLMTTSELQVLRERLRGARGSRRALKVLALANPLIESPLESLTHLALHDSGFPPPEPQRWLRGADGKRYRVDFYWPQFRLVLEADGRGKYRDEKLWDEKKRDLALTRAGYEVARVRWADLGAGWPAVAEWLRELMAQTR